jgi:hypothetical protein
MSWKLSAIVLSPGGDIVDSQHPKRFYSSSAGSSSGGVAGQTASAPGVPATSDQIHEQGDEEGSEVSTCDTYHAVVCGFYQGCSICLTIFTITDRMF